MNALDVSIARKAYRSERGELVAIEGLAFTVPQGQFACIVGPSGCGKTTLLSIIAGLDRDYRGVVSRNGRNLGMVFQTPRLMPWLTARENVRLAIDPPPRAPGRAEEMLAEMQLEPILYRSEEAIFDQDGLKNVQVTAKVLAHVSGEKLRVFKFKPKRGYRKRNGHRQELTRIEVTEIKQLSRKPPAKKADVAEKEDDE